MLFFVPARADVVFRRDCLCHNHASVRSLIDVVPMHKLVQRLNKVMARNLKKELGGRQHALDRRSHFTGALVSRTHQLVYDRRIYSSAAPGRDHRGFDSNHPGTPPDLSPT